MSASLYDLAIKQKIKGWTLDPDISVMGVDDTRATFNRLNDMNRDKPLNLPFITLTRLNPINIKITAKRPRTYEGKSFYAGPDYVDHLNDVPIIINYRLDIYTRYLSEADEYVRNFIFNIINYPSIDIIIPYNNSGKAYRSFMRLNNEINDNSDIPERLVPGQFSRMTLGITLDDAQLFSYSRKTPILIDGATVVLDDATPDATETWNNPPANVIMIKTNQENMDA